MTDKGGKLAMVWEKTGAVVFVHGRPVTSSASAGTGQRRVLIPDTRSPPVATPAGVEAVRHLPPLRHGGRGTKA